MKNYSKKIPLNVIVPKESLRNKSRCLNDKLIRFSFFSIFVFIAFIISSCTSSKEIGEVKGPPKGLMNQFTMLSVNVQHGLRDKTDVEKFADRAIELFHRDFG